MKPKTHITPKNIMTRKLVKQLFKLVDSELYWKHRHNPAINLYSPAGYVHKNNGYRNLKYENKNYRVHNLIWIYHGFTIPDGYSVGHADGDKLNNNINNLRLQDIKINKLLSRKHSNNTSGVKGVNFEDGKWVARVYIDNKNKRLGTFNTKEQAIEARQEGIKKYYGVSFYRED